MQRKRPRSSLWLYLFLNVLVSAATTLAVLFAWDTLRPPDESPAVLLPTVDAAAILPVETPGEAPTPAPTSTLPPAGEPLIEIITVVGAGDLEQELVMLKRLGEGNLNMPGWQLADSDGNVYTFPAQPELTLYKGGAVLVYTKPGTDTATEVYWGRESATYGSGDTVKLFDAQGTERASYSVP